MSISEEEKTRVKLVHSLIAILAMTKNKRLSIEHEVIKKILEELFGQLVAKVLLGGTDDIDVVLNDYFCFSEEGKSFSQELLDKFFQRGI